MRVKTARGRKTASTRWLQRQLNDPYVAAAQDEGYRSRAAFKLAQIDDKFHILEPGLRVLDLGAAPGGWTQVAVERAGEGHVLAVDLQPMTSLAGARILQCDLNDGDAAARIREAGQEYGGSVDVVLSDMSPAVTGHAATDHLRIVSLCEVALALAEDLLEPGGAFVAKVFQGGAQGGLLASLKHDFRSVRHFKPPASRKESAETYVIAMDYRGGGDETEGEKTPPQ
ncbi:MAG: RlmE family RNA methyltransferase [Alphaproteobacteria bacterium]|nr:RlmE family RNA methyltransferase [Alphaproteobacteria bacterium]